MKHVIWLSGILLATLVPASGAAQKPALQRIPKTVLADKIKGGWAGQMIGVSYGAPTEFRAQGKILEGELKWSPDRVSNAIKQDDLYVEMTFAQVMDTVGLNATAADYGEAFGKSQYSLWHANAAGRRNLRRGIAPPASGNPKHNLHANDIDFQIEADFIGLMCPGLPRTANQFCDRVGHVMNYGDGVYGGMFVCGMYAAGFLENDPRKVVQAGLACIPEKSTYAALIRDLLTWSEQHPDDWRKVWQLVRDKWDKNDPCPSGALSPYNIDAKLNGAYIAFGLLYGGGDFGRTMEISTRCGQDSDCNPSSAAGVLGVMLGFDGIPDEFKSGIGAIEDEKFDFTDYSFKDICESTFNRALKLIVQAGGKVTDDEVRIAVQTPRPPRLEQWDPGIPAQRLNAKDPAWCWNDQWTENKGAMTCNGPGGEASVRFHGVGVALIGGLSTNGGRATVYLDGKRLDVLEAYIPERTHDNALWHIFGLKAADHVLRIVTSAEADAASGGRRITIDRAIVYHARK